MERNGQPPKQPGPYPYRQEPPAVRRSTTMPPPRSPAEALEPARPHRPMQEPRRKPRKVFRIAMILNGAFTLLLIALIAAGGAFLYAKHQFEKPGPLTQDAVITIPKGEGVSAIAARLERQGIISDKRLFVASTLYFKAQNKLKAGQYAIPKGASMRQVLDTLVQGKELLYKVTIPEGLTSEQIVTRLLNHPELTGEIREIPPEGSLLPDTYKFRRGTKREEILARMAEAQRKFLDKVWKTRKKGLPIKTPREALILASIVEKETGRPEERARIAGVFINRLRKKMRLQSDPTIIYGLVGGKGSLGRPIRRSEINKKTAYNTYQIPGLPPTPIANPGRAAIAAVLQPEDTKDLYFVADGTGGHVFSETLAGHKKNVAAWRKIEAERRAREAERKARDREARQGGALALASSRPTDADNRKGKAQPQTVMAESIPGIIVYPGLTPGVTVEEIEAVAKSQTPKSKVSQPPSPNPVGQQIVSAKPDIPLPVPKPR